MPTVYYTINQWTQLSSSQKTSVRKWFTQIWSWTWPKLQKSAHHQRHGFAKIKALVASVATLTDNIKLQSSILVQCALLMMWGLLGQEDGVYSQELCIHNICKEGERMIWHRIYPGHVLFMSHDIFSKMSAAPKSFEDICPVLSFLEDIF